MSFATRVNNESQFETQKQLIVAFLLHLFVMRHGTLHSSLGTALIRKRGFWHISATGWPQYPKFQWVKSGEIW